VTTYDFIFSNHPRHRITRHAAFWLTWWIYFTVTYLLPTHAFPGWIIRNHNVAIAKYGFVFFLKKTLLYNSLPIVLAHAAFTYAIISFALPRYFFNRKNLVTTTFIFIGMMVVIYIASIGLMYIPYYRSYIIGTRKILPGISELIDLVNRSHLTNLPVVTGFAVMIKLMKRWWLKQKETEQMGREKARAELQLLKAQIHPHFLFNTLNNIYFFTMTASVQAPEMIKKLTAMLHYILNECNQPTVSVEKELKMIQDYIALEKIRYGEQIDIKTEIQEAGNNKMIAPLLLIPFVENSFKHGASKMITHPWVKLRITFEDDMLHFFIINSKPLSHESASRNGSIGLKNVQKRLLLLYPGEHELNIISEPENFSVFLKIQLKELIASPANAEETLETEEYAMA
jgi:sensor histidine kinase YesM